ncbi:hypothetical protein [Streptomyces sp. NPDC002402]
MAGYDFPRDLRDSQLRLHQVRAAYADLCQTLPWSVEPADGWTGDKRLYSDYVPRFEDSPGYSEQQSDHEARLRRLLLDLSVTVSTHPYWETLTGNVVEERMALKHTPGALTQPPADVLADAEGLAAQAV